MLNLPMSREAVLVEALTQYVDNFPEEILCGEEPEPPQLVTARKLLAEAEAKWMQAMEAA